MAKFPDFIIVGAMKCGTTVLWRNLNKHPHITMCNNPEDPKETSTEIRFWNNGQPHKTWPKGIEWYKNLFSGECAGEKCANYIESNEAIKRMAQHAPDMKLVLCVRNPVDRAYSEYQMQGRKKSFESFLSGGYIARGRYYNQIKNNVLPYFDKSNLYVVIQERMANNVDGEIGKIYQFLGLPHINIDVQRVSAQERDAQLGVYRVWKSPYVPMNPATRQKLLKLFHEDNKKLFNFLGYEIKTWKK